VLDNVVAVGQRGTGGWQGLPGSCGDGGVTGRCGRMGEGGWKASGAIFVDNYDLAVDEGSGDQNVWQKKGYRGVQGLGETSG